MRYWELQFIHVQQLILFQVGQHSSYILAWGFSLFRVPNKVLLLIVVSGVIHHCTRNATRILKKPQDLMRA